MRQYEGQSIAAIAQTAGKDPFTALFDLLQAAHCDVTMIDFIAAEDDICDILRDTHSCVISDEHLSHHRDAPSARLWHVYNAPGALRPRKAGAFHRICRA
ncbi:MAG: hypothetical protein ACLRSV_07215 [Oscillospiraceae bacterium]